MAASSSIARLPPSSGESIDFAFPNGTPDRLVDLRETFGDCFSLSSQTRPGHPCFLLSDPHLVSQILGKQHRFYVKGVGIDRVNILLGRGLMVSKGELWKSQRRMMQPPFRKSGSKQLLALMQHTTHRHLNRWRAEPQFDVVQKTSEATLDFILQAIFGSDVNELDQHAEGNPFDLVTREGDRNLLFARQFRALTSVVQAVVDKRRQSNRQAEDLLGTLMLATDRDGNPMTDKQLVDEVLTLVVAGHETTASALSWTWILLARHPETHSLLSEEAAGLSGDVATWPDQLPFTRAVLNESMRLYPPGWMLARRAIQSHQIGPYRIPTGSDILISPYVIHRHPHYWPEPAQFKPQRFMSPDTIVDQAFLPFSAGPRNCIGEHVAMLEMLLHVAQVARSVNLKLTAGTHIEMEAQINLRPSPPVFMEVEPR